MESYSGLINDFIEKLKFHIDYLEKVYGFKKRTYEICQFLRENYAISNDQFINSMIKIGANKIYEFLIFFDNDSKLSLEDIEEALYVCEIAEKNPKFKNQPRYISSYKLLEKIHIIFRTNIFRGSNNNKDRLIDGDKIIERYKKLLDFLLGKVDVLNLGEFESYRFHNANYSDEEWNEIYESLLKIQIERFISDENKKKEERELALLEEIEDNAQEVENDILGELPAQSAEIIKSNDSSIQPTNEVVETHVDNSKITDREILDAYQELSLKFKKYRYLGKIDDYKRDLFHSLYSGIDQFDNFGEVRQVLMLSDFKKFLYYCFTYLFENLTKGLNDEYPLSEIGDYTEFILEDLKKAQEYMNMLEEIIKEEESELEQLNQVQQKVVSNTQIYKLVFYSKNDRIELERSFKDFSVEKMDDLKLVLKKLEDTGLENALTVKKDVRILFHSVRGRYIFVIFRMLSDKHLLVYFADSLDNFKSINNKLMAYDKKLEDRINEIIKDGSSSTEYRKLMHESEKIREHIMTTGFRKEA